MPKTHARRTITWALLLVIGTGITSACAAEGGKVYGVGILGNCTTHGAGACDMFKKRSDTRVIAAYEKNPRRAKELEEVLGAPLAQSYDDVINDPRVEIVAITCDPVDKAAMVEKAAAAGKHIFLNKPMAESLDNARRIAAAVRKYDVKFVYDIQMVRSVPAYARLLDEVRAGKHGRVMAYHHLFGMNFAPAFDLKGLWPERLDPPEKSGGGEMTNMGGYAIDYAVALFGRPRSVLAKWQKTWDVYRAADVENFGQIVLDYGDFFAFLEAGKQQLEGKSGLSNTLTINFERQTFLIDAGARLASINNIAQDYDRFEQGATVNGSVEQLIAAIERGTPPVNDLDTAVLGTETLMAAYQSIRDGKAVTLPLASGKNPLISWHRK
jgi:predicted dehydrogenase